MLIITRRVGESITVGDQIVFTVLGLSKTGVRIGISAPSEITVQRGAPKELISAAYATENVPLAIFLEGKNFELTECKLLESAAITLMELMGYELESEEEPVFRSFLKRMWFRLKPNLSPEQAAKLIADGGDSLRSQLGRASVKSTSELASAAGVLIQSLDGIEDAVIHLGELILVKVTIDGVPRIRVENITQGLIAKLKEDPDLIKRPREFVDVINDDSFFGDGFTGKN